MGNLIFFPNPESIRTSPALRWLWSASSRQCNRFYEASPGPSRW